MDVEITEADGFAEREAALRMLKRQGPRSSRTVAGDSGYDTRGFVAGCRELGVTPHVAESLKRAGGSAIDGRTTRHRGYLASQRLRKRIEEIFGWSKDGRALRKMRVRGLPSVGSWRLCPRLQQPLEGGEAPRSGASVGHVSMKSGQSPRRRIDPLAQHAGSANAARCRTP